MSLLSEMLEHNKAFVESGTYERFRTGKFPEKKLAILACMDARLLELLPHALGLKNGDVKMIKNAGALVSHPWGSVMRSLVVAVYALRVREICVIAHSDCGMGTIDSMHILQEAHNRGIPTRVLNTLRMAGIDLDSWLRGFDNVDDSVRNTVELIRTHPLMPKDVPIHGVVMDPVTGAVRLLADGYKTLTKKAVKALCKEELALKTLAKEEATLQRIANNADAKQNSV
ncbi:MAG: carbonic anhydrase [Cystobacterineae bacterium]|nr:carbonic anhydrase [Cystobacterineae bacterium]